MSPSRKPLVIGGAVLGIVLLALVLLPFLLRDRIAERIRAEVDEAVDADVSWSGVELSFLRTFPTLTLGLRELSVVGTRAFPGDTLAAVDRVRVALDLGSVLRSVRGAGPVVVRSVRLEEPVLRLRVAEDGARSWEVVGDGEGRAEDGRPESPDPATAEGEGPGRGLAVELRSFEISDGRVLLDDARSGLYVGLEGLGHSLSGNFSQDSLVARTETRAESATVRFAGAPYLSDAALAFDADVAVRPADGWISFRDNELRLNDLILRFAGEAARSGDDLALDLTFQAPETDFRQILSLVPALYAEDFASLETSGRFAVDGFVRGSYGADAFPAFALRATVVDGSFRYPDLPERAQAIAADLAIENPGGDPDSTVVRLSRFHAEIGAQPLDAEATVRTPVSDPEVDARVRGTLDLDALARTVRLEGMEELGGVVTADAAVRARRSDVDSARWERVDAQGTVAARNVTLRSPDLRQPVAVEEAALTLSPEQAELTAFRAQLGSSDLQATGRIENLLGFALRDDPLRGTASFSSRRFVLDEWKSDDELQAIAVPSMLDLVLEGSIEELLYGPLEMRDARGTLTVRDERLTMDGFGFETLGGRIGMSGHYETTELEAPTFSLDVSVDSLDIAGASEAFLTVRTLAPVARYAQGTFSADMDLAGTLARDMTPVLDVLDGGGSLLTSRIAIDGFPLLERLSERLELSALARPTFSAVRSSLRIEDGRLHVAPFQVSVGGLAMMVDGSTGIDQSLDYSLGLTLPSGALGQAATRVLQDLTARAGGAGASLAGADSVRVAVRVGGTVADPALDLGIGETVASVRDLAGQAAGAAVQRQVDEARERLDAAEEEARLRAQARADSIVAEAEERAEAVRSEARQLAEQVRAEGDRRAEEVLSRATNPLARAAAEPVAARIRQEADERAEQIVREADERADALVEEARRRAGGGG